MKKLIYSLIAFWLTTSGIAAADTLAVWENDNLTGPEQNASADTVSPDLSSAVLGRGPGATTTSYINTFAMRHGDSADLATAIADERYLTATLSASPGREISFDEVFIRLTAQNATTFAVTFVLRSDLTGNTDLGTFSVGGTGNADGYLGLTFTQDLSGFSALQGATNVEFRLYIYGQSSEYAQNGIGRSFSTDGLDDLVFTGTAGSALGPAEFVYQSAMTSIKPGENQTLDVVIENTGFSATNVVSTLTASDSDFSVLSGSITNAAVASGASITNSFTIQASSSKPSGAYPLAFNLSVSGYGNDGSLSVANADVAVSVEDTVFFSMDNTGFAAALGGSDSNILTVSNTAAFALSYQLSDTTSGWLTYSTGLLLLPAGAVTNITITANAGTLSQGRYTGTLSVDYQNNGTQPDPAEITVTYDVGPKITARTGEILIAEVGGANQLPGKYEPGEVLEITITSTNDGAIPVSNTINTLVSGSGWTVSPTSDNYTSLSVGQSTSTTYTVTIPLDAQSGDEPFTVQNAAAGVGTWPGTFTVPVYYESEPSVVESSIILAATPGETVTASITLTNAGNKAVSYSIRDDYDWPFDTYAANWKQMGEDDWVDLGWEYFETNTRFTDWSGDTSASLDIGFDFPLYGTDYTTFAAGIHGALSLGSANVPENPDGSFLVPASGPVIAPFWSSLTLADPTENLRYQKESDRLVVSWLGAAQTNGGDELDFQAWLYPDGRVSYLYRAMSGAATHAGIGLQNPPEYNYLRNWSGEDLSGWKLDLFPTNAVGTSYSPSNGLLVGADGQTVNIDIDTSVFQTGTNMLNAIVVWGNGQSNMIPMTVLVVEPSLNVSPTSVVFSGPAGTVSADSTLVISNDGSVTVSYQIIETNAPVSGYEESVIPFGMLFPAEYYNEQVLFDSTATVGATSGLLPIGFVFPYCDETFTRFSIGMNGTIALGTDSSAPLTYQQNIGNSWQQNWQTRNCTLDMASPLSGITFSPDPVSIPDYLIAPYWSELAANENTQVRYYSDGAKLVVTWSGLTAEGASAQTFQAVLKATGEIEFHYGQLDGYPVWSGAEIGLRCAAPEDTDIYSLNLTLPTAVESVQTNYTYTTNYLGEWPVVSSNVSGTVTTYVDQLSDYAVRLTPAAGILDLISVSPQSGTLPPGASQPVTFYGDATGLNPGGSNEVSQQKAYSVMYAGGSVPVDVEFTATNVQPPLAMAAAVREMVFGSDAIVDVVQNADGSRTISWPEPANPIKRNYIVQYTTSLAGPWQVLAELGPYTTSYTDYTHTDEPVLFYRVVVE